MKKDTSVACLACGHIYPREPALEVACPTCGVAVGRKCREVRPSGHVPSDLFRNLPSWGHDARELLACAEGFHQHDGCAVGLSPEAARARYEQLRAIEAANIESSAREHMAQRRTVLRPPAQADLFGPTIPTPVVHPEGKRR